MTRVLAELVAFSLATVLTAGASAQSTWYVDDDGNPPGTGTPDDPYTSIQYAIDQATTLDGDAIVVAGGTYAEDVNLGGKMLAIHGDPADRPVLVGQDLSDRKSVV